MSGTRQTHRGPLALLAALALSTAPALAGAVDDPGMRVQRGDAAYRAGDFDTARQQWDEALAAGAAIGPGRGDLLLRLAAAEQSLGQDRAALQRLEQARALLEDGDDPEAYATVLDQLAAAYTRSGLYERAEPALDAAMHIAEANDDLSLQARILFHRGQLQELTGRTGDALRSYSESVKRSSGDQLTALQAMLQATALLLEAGEHVTAATILAQFEQAADGLAADHADAFLLIRAARLYRRLSAQHPPATPVAARAAARLLLAAADAAEQLQDPVAASYAWGYLGALYEDGQRYRDALDLTGRALRAVQDRNVPEMRYQWEWQQGRLLRALGDDTGAIASYRSAIATLDQVRLVLFNALDAAGRSYYREIAPLSQEFADLLLKHSDTLADPRDRERQLLMARDTMESLKLAELQDYFRDDCIAATERRVVGLDTHLPEHAAIIYPMLFPDRSEILLGTVHGWSHQVVDIPAARVASQVSRFRASLSDRESDGYLETSRALYDWLIRPIRARLDAADIDTLVFVPDPGLRALPFAALHDGQHFVIEQFAVATTPSLKLTDPRPLATNDTALLLAGLSQPVQGFSALQYVPRELQQIKSVFAAEVLQDESFVKSRFQDELKRHDYAVVHIASHGQFDGKVQNSFVLTYDGKLSMDDLQEYLGLSRLRIERPVELLTLSACQTAVGDERASLGLASIAIKAGVRSALATLWFIDDRATSDLMTEFYRRLQLPGATKAKALQQAQLAIGSRAEYRHPAYWAPFLLIGNWL